MEDNWVKETAIEYIQNDINKAWLELKSMTNIIKRSKLINYIEEKESDIVRINLMYAFAK